MELVLLGTGAAWPDAYRSAPAFLIKSDNENYLLDCGGGVCHQLMKSGVPPSTLTTILLSHMHIDHCVEFPSLVFGAYLTGKTGEFSVYGPKGTEHFTRSIFDDTYNFAKPMMKKLRDKDIVISVMELENGLVLEEGNITIECAPVQHGIPTLAYKITENNKSVVFSGDTAPCDSLINLSMDVDILVAECSFPEEMGKKPGHLIPSQIGDIASKANAKKVILTHLFPPCKGKEEEIINEVSKVFKGEIVIGNDLQTHII